MAKIWKAHHGESTRVYDIESLEEEAAFSRGEMENPASLSSSFQHLNTSEEDQPLDLSCSKSKLDSQEQVVLDDGEGSDERDSHSTTSNDSPLSERSFSPESQESSRRKKSLSRDAKWMRDQGISDHISIEDVIQLENARLKQTLESLVLAGKLTEEQISELMRIRKRGKNTEAAKKSRKKKDNEIVRLKKVVDEKKENLRPVAKEHRELLLEYSFQEEKLAALNREVLSRLGKNPDEYQVVVRGEEVQISLREEVVVD